MGRKDGVGVREFQFHVGGGGGGTNEVLATKVTFEQRPEGRMSPYILHHYIPKKKKKKKWRR